MNVIGGHSEGQLSSTFCISTGSRVVILILLKTVDLALAAQIKAMILIHMITHMILLIMKFLNQLMDI